MNRASNSLEFETLPSVREGSLCLLWADLAGFSALSTRLSKDPDGQELIAHALGELISQGITLAQKAGATPISLGGDSWMVAWPVAQDDAHAARAQLHKAIEAASVSHALCQSLSIRHGMDFKLRIVCTVGSARWFRIPTGTDRSNQILRGPVISTAASLLARCAPGHTLMDEGIALESDTASFPAEVATKASAPPAVLNSMQRGVCISVFATAGLRHLQDDAAEQAIEHLTQEARKLCSQFGALFARARVDEKGCNVLMLLGFGPQTSTNNARDAVAIARLLHDRLIDRIPDLGIGVCSGRVFACEVGHGPLVEFTAMGECINTSAHVSANYPGGVWLDALSAEMSGNEDDPDDVIDVTTKGTDGSQQFLRLRRLGKDGLNRGPDQAARESRLAYIEREQTLRRLKSQLAERRWCCLVGEAGSGKSVALEMLKDDLGSAQGAVMLTGRCTPEHALGHGSAINQLLMDWVRHSADSETARIGILKEAAALCPPPLRLVLAHLGPERSATDPENSPIDLALVTARLPAFCAWWASELLSARHLVCMDDIHWIDALSRQCLAAIKASAPHIGGVFTSRHSLGALDLNLDIVELGLAALTALDVERLLQLQCQVQHVEPEVVHHVMQITAGNCMFVTRWVREAMARGWYRKSPDSLMLVLPSVPSHPQRLDPPIALHLLLQTTIEGLSEAAKGLSSLVGAYGKALSLGELAALCGLSDDKDSALRECIDRKVLAMDPGPSDSGVIRFEHALLREACYARMDSHARAKVHQRIAQALESGLFVKSTPMECAWHWMRATVGTPEVLDRIVSGALWARRVNATDVALDLLDYALMRYRDMGPPAQPKAQEVFLWQALTKCQQGKTMAATEVLREAALKHYPDRANVLLSGAYLAHHAVMFTRRWFERVGARRDSQLLAREEDPKPQSLLFLAEANYFSGAFAQYQWYAICGLNAAERTDSGNALTSAYAGMAVQTERFGLHRISNAYALLALGFSRRSRDVSLVVEALLFLALRDTGSARWRSAQRHIDLAMRRNLEYGRGRRHDELLVVKGYLLQGMEDYVPASQMFSELWRSGLGRNDPQTAVWGLLGCARIAHLRGDLTELRQKVARLQTANLPDVLSRLDFDALRAVLAYCDQDRQTCIDVLLRWPARRLQEIGRVSFSVGYPLTVLYLISEAIQLAGAATGPLSDIAPKNYLGLLRSHGSAYPINQSRALVAKALHFRLHGKTSRAEAALDDAGRVAARLGQTLTTRQIGQLRANRSGNGEQWLVDLLNPAPPG